MNLSLRWDRVWIVTRRKPFKNLSSTFLKAVRKIEPEVVAKLEEGNKEDHSRHEDYVLSFIEDPLKTQVCSYLFASVVSITSSNRGLYNANTIRELSKLFDKNVFDSLMESLVKVVKRIYVQPNSIIFDVKSESSAKWAGILLIRHGEVGASRSAYPVGLLRGE